MWWALRSGTSVGALLWRTGAGELPTLFADLLSDASDLADALGVDWNEATRNGRGITPWKSASLSNRSTDGPALHGRPPAVPGTESSDWAGAGVRR